MPQQPEPPSSRWSTPCRSCQRRRARAAADGHDRRARPSSASGLLAEFPELAARRAGARHLRPAASTARGCCARATASRSTVRCSVDPRDARRRARSRSGRAAGAARRSDRLTGRAGSAPGVSVPGRAVGRGSGVDSRAAAGGSAAWARVAAVWRLLLLAEAGPGSGAARQPTFSTRRPCRPRSARRSAPCRPADRGRSSGGRRSPSGAARRDRTPSACRAGSAPGCGSCRPGPGRCPSASAGCPAGCRPVHAARRGRSAPRAAPGRRRCGAVGMRASEGFMMSGVAGARRT